MVGIIKVSNRNCLGGFTDSFQLREVEMDMEDKRNGKLIEYGIEKLEDAVKKAKEIGILYPYTIDLYWGCHEKSIKLQLGEY